jgi:general secretion pathway protein M
LKALLDSLKQWWAQLSASDQSAIRTGGIVVLIFMIIMLIIVPTIQSYRSVSASLPILKSQLSTMRAQNLEARRLQAAPSTRTQNESILSMLEKSTVTHGIKANVQSLTPRSDTSASIRLKSIEYGTMLKWLAGLSSQYHLRISEAEINRTDAPGIVDAFLVIGGTS